LNIIPLSKLLTNFFGKKGWVEMKMRNGSRKKFHKRDRVKQKINRFKNKQDIKYKKGK